MVRVQGGDYPDHLYYDTPVGDLSAPRKGRAGKGVSPFRSGDQNRSTETPGAKSGLKTAAGSNRFRPRLSLIDDREIE